MSKRDGHLGIDDLAPTQHLVFGISLDGITLSESDRRLEAAMIAVSGSNG